MRRHFSPSWTPPVMGSGLFDSGSNSERLEVEMPSEKTKKNAARTGWAGLGAALAEIIRILLERFA